MSIHLFKPYKIVLNQQQIIKILDALLPVDSLLTDYLCEKLVLQERSECDFNTILLTYNELTLIIDNLEMSFTKEVLMESERLIVQEVV